MVPRDLLADIGWVRLRLPSSNLVIRLAREMASSLDLLDMTAPPNVAERWNSTCHRAMTQEMWDGDYVYRIACDNRELLQELCGGPVAVQAHPYLRIARPNQPSDNIGLHRDSDYGQSEDEWTVHLALSQTDEHGCLRFLSGSHKGLQEPVEVPSSGGQEDLGRPARMLNYPSELHAGMTAVPLEIGAAVIFNPRVIHGQIVNGMDVPRIAVDFRVVRADLPVAHRDGGAWYRRLNAREAV